MDRAKKTARRGEKHFSLGIWCTLYQRCGSMYYMYALYHIMYVSLPKSIEPAGIQRKTKLLPIENNVYHSSSIWFGLRLDRHPLYHVFNLVLPTVLLALLSAFVYIIPMESGDKISYIITILLAFFIFLLLLSGHIPPTPGAGPLLGKTYMCITTYENCRSWSNWDRYNMATILQMTLWKYFSCDNSFIWRKYHWNLLQKYPFGITLQLI